MSKDIDKGNKHYCWQIFPVEVEHVFYEVNYWNGHDNEENEHRDHREDAIKDGIE